MKLDRISFLFLFFLILASFGLLVLVMDSPPGNIRTRGVAGLFVDYGQEYQEKVREVFSQYLSGRSQLETLAIGQRQAEWLKLLEKMREDLLSLKLGYRFQKTHLMLIIQIGKMREDLLAGREEKAREAEAELFKLFNQI